MARAYNNTTYAIASKYNCTLSAAAAVLNNANLYAVPQEDGKLDIFWQAFEFDHEERYGEYRVAKDAPNRRALVRRARNRRADAIADYFAPCLAGGRKVTSADYFTSTAVVWHECADAEITKTAPSFVSESGSAYWETADGVYRCSNHWGRRVASCSWFLDSITARDSMMNQILEEITITSAPVVAYAPFSAFISKGYQSIVAIVKALATVYAA